MYVLFEEANGNIGARGEERLGLGGGFETGVRGCAVSYKIYPEP